VTILIIAGGIILALLFGLQIWMRIKAKKLVGEELSREIAQGEFFAGEENKIIYFFSISCSACKQMMPVIDELISEFPGRIKKADVARNMDLARHIGIMATPTTVIIKGRSVIDVLLGVQSRKKLLGFLTERK
jgi:thioredoxin 1